MKKQTLFLFITTIALACTVHAQPGRVAGSQAFNNVLAKLFGETPAFTADIDVEMNTADQPATSMPGKLAMDSTKSRYEMNFSDAKGGKMPAGYAERMKAMGMDRTIAISRPDTKTLLVIFPGLNAYVESPLRDDASKADSTKVDLTELGKEDFNGHPCIKYKAVITDDQGKAHEATLWKATDLKKFPIKIQTEEQGHTTTILFTNIKTDKPDAALFEAPKDYKKYDSQQQLMQQEIMKRMGGQNMAPAQK